MKVAGDVIKTQRISYGLSQQKLALGICAQATISLIENQNSCPNLEILHPVCHRLNLKLRSVVNVNRNLRDVETAFLKKDLRRARRIFQRLSRRKFQRQHSGCYFCYRGIFALRDSDYFNALYFFNKSLNVRHRDRFYQAWANLGLGRVYLKHRDNEKALEFIELAERELNLTVGQQARDRFQLFVNLRLQISSLLSDLREFWKANAVNYRTISILVEGHSMYRLGAVYQQLHRNYSRLNDSHHARLALQRARVFQYLYQAPKSLSK